MGEKLQESICLEVVELIHHTFIGCSFSIEIWPRYSAHGKSLHRVMRRFDDICDIWQAGSGHPKAGGA